MDRPGSVTPTPPSRRSYTSVRTSPLTRRGAHRVPPNLEWDAARTAAEQLADWFPGFKPPSAPHVHHDGERARPDSEVLLDADVMLSPHDPWNQGLEWRHSKLGLNRPSHSRDYDGTPLPDSPLLRPVGAARLHIQDLRRSDPFDLEEAAGSALFLDPRSKTLEPDSHKLSASRSPSPAHARHSSFGGHGSTRGSSSTLGLFEPSAFAVSAPGQELANSSEEISPVAGAGRQSRTGSWSSTDNPRLVDAEGALLGSTSPRQRGLRQTPNQLSLAKFTPVSRKLLL